MIRPPLFSIIRALAPGLDAEDITAAVNRECSVTDPGKQSEFTYGWSDIYFELKRQKYVLGTKPSTIRRLYNIKKGAA